MGASWTGARQKQLVLQTCTAPGHEAALWAAMRTAGLHPCSYPQLLSELPHLAGHRGGSTDELQVLGGAGLTAGRMPVQRLVLGTGSGSPVDSA